MNDELAPNSSSDASSAELDPSAGFWLRLGAYAIDVIVIGVVGLATYFLPAPFNVLLKITLSLAYTTVMPMAFAGQTLGKMAAGIAIIREDGQSLTYFNTFLRAIGYWFSSLTLSVGFICAAFTDHKRALHDYIAGTRVIRLSEISGARKVIVILIGILLPLLFIPIIAHVALVLQSLHLLWRQ